MRSLDGGFCCASLDFFFLNLSAEAWFDQAAEYWKTLSSCRFYSFLIKKGFLSSLSFFLIQALLKQRAYDVFAFDFPP
jgi:hypothetical protein